jgi:hypothetical protein
MVKIPRAGVSEARLSTDVPSQQNPRAFGDRSLEIIGSALTEVGRKFQEINNLNQTVDQSSAMNKKFFEIQKQAEEHQDPFTLEETYGPMFDQAAQEAVEGIDDPATRAKFKMEADQSSLMAQRALREAARVKQNAHYRANIVVKNEEDKELLFKERDPGNRHLIKNRMFQRIFEAERAGAYGEDEAALLTKSLKDEIRLGQVRHDISVDAAEAYENIDGKENVYGLTAEEKTELKGEALAMRKKQKEQIELEAALNTGKMDQEIGQRLIDDDISQDELEDLFILTQLGKPGGISKTIYDIGTKAIKSPKSVDPGMDEGSMWLNLNDQFMDIYALQQAGTISRKENFAKLAKFRADLIQARAVDGIISKDKATKWFQMIEPYYDKNLDEQARHNFKQRNGWWKNTWNGINVFVDEFAGEDDKVQMKAQLGNEIMLRLLHGEEQDPETVINEITKREQMRINPNRALYPLKSEWEISPGVKGTVIGYRLADGEPILFYED